MEIQNWSIMNSIKNKLEKTKKNSNKKDQSKKNSNREVTGMIIISKEIKLIRDNKVRKQSLNHKMNNNKEIIKNQRVFLDKIIKKKIMNRMSANRRKNRTLINNKNNKNSKKNKKSKIEALADKIKHIELDYFSPTLLVKIDEDFVDNLSRE